jgi:CheY-like chemotaxis protein
MPKTALFILCGNAERRESFLSALSKEGWLGILSAAGMPEAAKMMRNVTSACVIVDAELEDIPGLKAVPILRSLCEQIKIIFTASENTLDLEAQVRALDVFYYYIGSADRMELVAAVKDAIGAPTRGRAGRPPKVLVVDDDPDFHVTVRTVLSRAGYSMVSAYSEREGLDAARRENPDIILLDIIMQTTTDGFEFCREAKRDPRIKHTPILGISAIEKVIGVHHPPDFDTDLFPVDGFLSKPVTPEKLFAELERLIPRPSGTSEEVPVGPE